MTADKFFLWLPPVECPLPFFSTFYVPVLYNSRIEYRSCLQMDGNSYPPAQKSRRCASIKICTRIQHAVVVAPLRPSPPPPAREQQQLASSSSHSIFHMTSCIPYYRVLYCMYSTVQYIQEVSLKQPSSIRPSHDWLLLVLLIFIIVTFLNL